MLTRYQVPGRYAAPTNGPKARLCCCILLAMFSAGSFAEGMARAGANSRTRPGGHLPLLGNRPRQLFAEQPKDSKAKGWPSTKPETPVCSLTSELKSEIRWKSMKGAQSYVLYWSTDSSFETEPVKAKANKLTLKRLSAEHVVRIGEYGARLPVYYRIAGVKSGVESELSDTCVVRLLSSQNGTRCQICGEKAVGHCHLRDIYVCSGHTVFTSDSGSRWRCP
jgi:hypothetical protein